VVLDLGYDAAVGLAVVLLIGGAAFGFCSAVLWMYDEPHDEVKRFWIRRWQRELDEKAARGEQ